MGFIPVGDLLRQLVLAFGAAMIVGSVAVLVRERRERRDPEQRPDRPRPNMKIVVLNVVVGAILTLWGVGSLIAAG